MEELQASVAGVEFAESESVTLSENGPGASGVAVLATVTEVPVALLKPIHAGPDNFHVYGAFPPDAASGMARVRGKSSVEGGQLPVICSGGSCTFNGQARVAGVEFALSFKVNVNE